MAGRLEVTGSFASRRSVGFVAPSGSLGLTQGTQRMRGAKVRKDLGLQHERRSTPCATVVRILARRPDSSPDPSLRESHLSPHVSQSNVASHSPRQNALPQAQTPRRQAIPSLLPRDCRLRRATGGLRRRFAIHLRLQMRKLQEKRTGGAASTASGGQSREEFFAGRRARRRAGSPRWLRAEAKDARSAHLGDGLSVGAREKPRRGLLPAASRSDTLTVVQSESSFHAETLRKDLGRLDVKRLGGLCVKTFAAFALKGCTGCKKRSHRARSTSLATLSLPREAALCFSKNKQTIKLKCTP